MSGDRMTLDRLWPLLCGLAALLGGALLLQGYAERRGNDTIRIAIHDERLVTADEDAPDDGVEGSEEGPALSARHAQARLLARRAEFDRALPLYEAELAARPGSATLLGEYGAWLAVSGAPERALPALAKADALRPTATTALRLGTVRSRLGDAAGAEADLRRALALKPGSAGARLALGRLLLRRGEPTEAITLLEAAAGAGSNEDRARALVALGAARLQGGRRDEAERSFERAILFAPARAEIRIGIARAWLAVDGRESALRAAAVLQKAAEMAPDLPAVHAALGRARERTGEPQLAEEAYDRAVRLDPAYRSARRRLLRLALARRDFGRARHEAERLVAEGPDVPEHHFLAALVADREGRHDDARAAYRKAIAVARGDYPEAWLNLGVLEKAEGRFPAAKTAYEAALKLRPAYPAAWINLGKLHEAARRPADAEAAYRRAIAVDARSGAAWLALGQLLSDRRRWAEAEGALREALAVRPTPATRLSLGVVQARSGKPEAAVAVYREVLSADPRNVAAWYDLALAQAQLGRDGEVRSALAQALAVDPAHLPSLRRLADLELRAGRLADARRILEELLDLAPADRAARKKLAEVAARAGDRAGCEARVAQLRAEAPGDPAVAALAARCAGGVAAVTSPSSADRSPDRHVPVPMPVAEKPPRGPR